MRTAIPAPLAILFQTASQWVLQGVLNLLAARGYSNITESHLNLIGNLDCGTTYASAVAQRMGVSRQAINRTVHELQVLGILRLEPDPARRNQKLVVMTKKGTRLVTEARAALAVVETTLAQRIGTKASNAMRNALEESWGDSVGADKPTE